MSRVKTPDGKRVGMSVKVSEAKAAAVDAARGSTCRALWLEAAIDAALGGKVQKAPAKEKPPRPRERRAAPRSPGSALFSSPETAPPVTEVPARDPGGRLKNCPHPKARVIKGFCGACGRNVGEGGAR